MNGGTCKNLEDIIQLVAFVNEKICNYLLSFLCNIGEKERLGIALPPHIEAYFNHSLLLPVCLSIR